ncbi:MAG TPA: hypothetical protein VGI29_00380, partial [Candidatus Binataceae bacterium]
AVFCAAAIIVNYLTNPYGAWRTALIDPIFRADSDPRMITPYLVRTMQPETLLVGSSRVRVGMAIEQGYRDGVLNGALQGVDAEEAVEVVRVALGSPKLKRIVWGVDFFSFDESRTPDRETMARLRGDPWIMFSETLLNLEALDAGRREFNRAWHGRNALRAAWTRPVPWPQAEVCARLAAPGRGGLDTMGAAKIQLQLIGDVPDYTGYRLSQRKLNDLAAAVALARRRGVEVIVFVPPISGYVLEVIRQSGQWPTFLRWKRELLAVGPYWDFSGYHALAPTPGLFRDVMHFRPAVGHLLLRRLLGLDTSGCDLRSRVVTEAGMWVDARALCDVQKMQEARMRAATASQNDFVRAAAKALAARGFSPAVLMAKGELMERDGAAARGDRIGASRCSCDTPRQPSDRP